MHQVLLRIMRRLRIEDCKALGTALREVNAHVTELAICSDCDVVFRIERRSCPTCAGRHFLPLSRLAKPVGGRVLRFPVGGRVA